MSSKSIVETHSDREGPPDDDQQPMRETAPSLMRQDEPRFARILALIGTVLFLTPGTVALVRRAYGQEIFIGPGLGLFLVLVGLATLLIHAAVDTDPQVRRAYGIFGFLWLAGGVFATLLPTKLGPAFALFLPYGAACAFVALLFLMCFARNETDKDWHGRAVLALGLAGTVMALTGFIGGSISTAFLLPHGLVLGLLGLGYLGAFVGLEGTASDLGHRAGLGIGAMGLAALLVALGRSAPGLFHALGVLGTRPEPYFTGAGFLLCLLSLLYVGVAAMLCSDSPLVVMTRRELSAFFYSPIAYIVLIGLAFVGWVQFDMFVMNVQEAAQTGSPLVEPVVRYYIFHFLPVVSVLFVVPALTMRLLSEEKRAGTVEMLLTAPLGEAAIVGSKFLAVLLFFLVLWLPWGLFLVALRMEAGQPFDYRPLLSFLVALIASGAGFLSMGLFFSSLSKNQIIAAVLTFMGMMILISIYFVTFLLPGSSPYRALLAYMSFVSFWQEALEGRLWVRDILFHVSTAVFWLFLTVKVLEARKWT